MAGNFYTIVTAIGQAKIANAYALGTPLNLTTFKVGDGNGAYYNPTVDQISLKHPVWSGNISSIYVDADNPNWIVIEIVIPSTEGGFMIREAAIFDDVGNMIAIGKYPETYKPVVAEGSAKDLYIKMILEVSNTASITLKVDPSVVLATKKDITILQNQISGMIPKSEKGVVGGVALFDTVTSLSAVKMELYISETLPAISDRKKNTMYLKMTSTLDSGTSNNLKVSPAMGIKIVQEEV